MMRSLMHRGLPENGVLFSVDIPGYTIEWSFATAHDRISRRREIVRTGIPIFTGLAAAAAYDIAGLAVVAFAPPPLKPVGLAMIAPGPTEPILFAGGYWFGTQIEDHIPDWAI